MKAVLFALLIAGTAQAGTVYRDRPFPVPTGSPCVIQWTKDVNINVGMLAYFNIAEREALRQESAGLSYKWVVDRKYLSLKIHLMGGATWEIEGTREALEKRREELIQQIKECR